MKRIFSPALALVIGMCATLSLAYISGTLTPHNHSGSSSGGSITNLTLGGQFISKGTSTVLGAGGLYVMKLGVLTATPLQAADIRGNLSLSGIIWSSGTSASIMFGGLNIGNPLGTDDSPRLKIMGDMTPGIDLLNCAGGTCNTSAQIILDDGLDLNLSNDKANATADLILKTQSTDRLHITGLGKIGIGKANPGSLFETVGGSVTLKGDGTRAGGLWGLVDFWDSAGTAIWARLLDTRKMLMFGPTTGTQGVIDTGTGYVCRSVDGAQQANDTAAVLGWNATDYSTETSTTSAGAAYKIVVNRGDVGGSTCDPGDLCNMATSGITTVKCVSASTAPGDGVAISTTRGYIIGDASHANGDVLSDDASNNCVVWLR